MKKKTLFAFAVILLVVMAFATAMNGQGDGGFGRFFVGQNALNINYIFLSKPTSSRHSL